MEALGVKQKVSLRNFNCKALFKQPTTKTSQLAFLANKIRPSRSAHHVVSASSDQIYPEGDELATEFSRILNETGLDAPQRRSPSHLLSPNLVIAAQLDALQRNNWPETDAGVRVCFEFSIPEGVDDLTTSNRRPTHVRTWAAKEEYLDFKEFSNVLHSKPYNVLLECESWEPVSQLMFPSNRYENKAIQAVEVKTQARSFTFTFCIEKSIKGPYKGCWLTTGVRQGDYTV